jgi:hypothetical protein
MRNQWTSLLELNFSWTTIHRTRATTTLPTCGPCKEVDAYKSVTVQYAARGPTGRRTPTTSSSLVSICGAEIGSDSHRIPANVVTSHVSITTTISSGNFYGSIAIPTMIASPACFGLEGSQSWTVMLDDIQVLWYKAANRFVNRFVRLTSCCRS